MNYLKEVETYKWPDLHSHIPQVFQVKNSAFKLQPAFSNMHHKVLLL